MARTKRWLGPLAIPALAMSPSACSSTASPHPQLVVVIDTDAHVVEELPARGDVSPAAAIDSLRVDVLDSSNRTYATNAFILSDASSWPLSFGVAAGVQSSEVRLRIRAFRALLAHPGTHNGSSVLDPPPEVTIERLAWLVLPTSGVSRVRVLLTENCMGISSSFLAPETTCLDAMHPAADPHDGVEALADVQPPATRVGTWAAALERPCTATSTADQVCIPGGFSILGDYDAAGADVLVATEEPFPLHPVLVSPFLLDKYEFTVGRFRRLVQSGAFSADVAQPTMPTPGDSLLADCTWLGASDGTNDQLPLNCVSYATASLACELSGGTLPTEAQWEHAARGRGEGRRYPWGNAEPQCCTVSAGRGSTLVPSAGCRSGTGVEEVGSHAPIAACDNLGDVSKDGVFDMAGSLTEALLDDFQAYSAACWGRGVLNDPVCKAMVEAHSSRGAYWNAGLAEALLVLRHVFVGVGESTVGFRCAYPGSTP